ncbi:PREDICTED: UPF0481 protein At3g47200-like [Fragaria vesca subsp. vesca]|uniref:UPF0481 protein At3g47200-like n=1 Tax=Fragaria vesca subsp. vesca TaxID=101020 RepID=UPI0002C2E0C6|nr:PREDICTED: UPF0481 protein At3g47200-like [Fragaria vesca subsp. vesca]XP_011465387.1 PREDICTED: UPF0481 protein At3g47200-like [Fragaria vesca subsp. vesca]
MANDIESSKSTCSEIETSDSVTEDYECKAIVEALNTAAKLRIDSLWSAKWCIFRVPKVLQRHKPEAYRPHVVSIGPFHHRGEQFQPIQAVKQWYLHNLLSLRNMSLKTLIQGIDNISEFEKRARECYAEPLDLNHDEFIEMMVIDGCFLIELFRKHFYWSYRKVIKKDLVPAEELNIDKDPIFNMDCMLQYIFQDLMLLENQLPWFVLECLFGLTMEKHVSYSLNELVLVAFRSQRSLACNLEFYLRHTNDDDGDEVLHILDLVRSATTYGFKNRELITSSELILPPATLLSKAGIKFIESTDCGIMDMDFKDGVFAIPQLSIIESTEPLLRNLIAFEQCCQGRSPKVTSYVSIMNSLITTSKDMDLLCRKGIIRHYDPMFFNKLLNDTKLNNFYFTGLCNEVNKHYIVSWNKWLEKLKRDYFSNPWAITSLVAASIFLVLTLLQTTYTIRQYYSPR